MIDLRDRMRAKQTGMSDLMNAAAPEQLGAMTWLTRGTSRAVCSDTVSTNVRKLHGDAH